MNVETEDSILLARPLQPCDLCLQLVLWLPLLGMVWWSTMVSSRTVRPAVLLLCLMPLRFCLVLLVLRLGMLLGLRLPMLLLLLLLPSTTRSINTLSSQSAHGWWGKFLSTDVSIAEALSRSLWATGPWGAATSEAGGSRVVHPRCSRTFTVGAFVERALASAALETEMLRVLLDRSLSRDVARTGRVGIAIVAVVAGAWLCLLVHWAVAARIVVLRWVGKELDEQVESWLRLAVDVEASSEARSHTCARLVEAGLRRASLGQGSSREDCGRRRRPIKYLTSFNQFYLNFVYKS